MFERDIFHYYQLVCDERKSESGYRTFTCRGDRYIVIPQLQMSYELLQEMTFLSSVLQERGENELPVLQPTITGMPSAYVDGESVIIFRMEHKKQERKVASLGMELAEFHKRGKGVEQYYPVQQIAYGQWPLLWISRVDEMHNKYAEISVRKQKNDFDTLFLTTFPYYEGLAENAIQYITDYQMERGPRGIGSASICYDRFSERSWIETDNGYIKMPVGWLIDSPMRDVAECIREKIYQPQFRNNEIVDLIDDYEKVKPLSKGAWRLLYGRLLFPTQYFDTVEGHYKNEREIGMELYSSRFTDLISYERQNEYFLKSFFRSIGLPVHELNIPIVDWLVPTI
ncbi:spore coat putative kinase YutH [Bacillus sp. NEB1478]|uniref:spore coat putative kinase YutH n=1 Tax=Bacillus sp. NEB1478 TaxID=3073816 RepID=UPI002872FB39|nr:spore coat protein YutH [Bacillus sp. NEB1478]WNB92956.1 spore coat protein YutH [Bacillus sp. NEB1478]